MTILSFAEFDAVYQPVFEKIWHYWHKDMQREIAVHCVGWAPEAFGFGNYLKASSLRSYEAYRSFAERGNDQTVCDVGGFWGVFPIVLKQLGFTVTMTEALKYYSQSFDALFDYIRSEGVSIIDYDPFEEAPKELPKFDVVTVMAVLEHYPHSPKDFMDHMHTLLKADGWLYIEVPNIAYWPKRLAFLRGLSPITSIETIYRSKKPYIGHHHEYTWSELRQLLELSDFRPLKQWSFNYSIQEPLWRSLRYRPITTLMTRRQPDTRETLAILGTPRRHTT